MKCVTSLIRALAALAVLILLSACGSSNDDNGGPLDDDSNPPSMPVELTGTVYSAHKIELFWKASSDDGWVMGYDIYRDSVLVAEQLDAKSYYDDTLEPAIEYVYTVIAVDDKGNRSTPASVTLVTPAAIIQPLIDRNNYSKLLSHVFEIYVGDVYNEPLIAMSEFGISGRNPDGSFIDVYNCETGGYAQSLDPSSTLSGVGFMFDFDSCLQNGVIYDGMLSGRNSSYAETLRSENGFSIQVHPELKTTFVGGGVFNTTMSRNDTLHQWAAGGLSVDSVSIDGTLQLDSVNSSFGYGLTGGDSYKRWLNGGFNVRSDATAGALLVVDTPVGLGYECDSQAGSLCGPYPFSSGQLELLAEDGSTLVLDAETPPYETVNITISNNLGVETFPVEWSEWQALLSFKRFPADAVDWVSAQKLATAVEDDGPAIRRDNYMVLLDHAFDVLTGYNAIEALSAAQNFINDSQPAETNRASGVRTDSYVCETDGAALALRVDNDESIYPLDYRVSFDQCEFDEFQFLGDIRGQEVRLDGGVAGFENANLNWLDGGGDDYTFRGQSSVQRIGSGMDTECIWSADEISLHTQSAESADSVVNGRIEIEAHGSVDTGYTVILSSNIQIVSAMTEGFEISITAELEMSNSAGTNPGEWSFSAGGIKMDAYDKSNRWSSGRSKLEYHVEDSVVEISNSDFLYEDEVSWTSWQSRVQPMLDRLCGDI